MTIVRELNGNEIAYVYEGIRHWCRNVDAWSEQAEEYGVDRGDIWELFEHATNIVVTSELPNEDDAQEERVAA